MKDFVPCRGERVHLVGIGGAGHERDRPDPVGPRGRRLGLRREGLPGRCSRCARWVPGWRRPRRGEPARARPPPSSSRPRSARPTRSSRRPGRGGLTVLHRAQALAALIRGRRRRLRRRHRTARPRPRRCSPSRCSTAGSTPPSRSAATSPPPAPARTRGRRRLRRRGRRERRRRSWCSPRTWPWSPTSRPTTSTTTAPSAAYAAAFEAFLDRLAPGGALVRLRGRPGRRGAGRPAESRGVRVRRYGRTATGAGDACCSTSGPTAPARGSRCATAGPSSWCGWPCPASTWRSTRSPRCWPGSSWAPTRRACSRGSPGSAGCAGGSSSRAAPAACGLRRLRPPPHARSPPSCAPPARSPAPRRRAAARGVPAAPVLPDPEFAADFGSALALADEVVVLDVYGAREDPEPGVTGALVADAVPLPAERVHYEPRWSDVPARGGRARPPRRPGDHDGRRRRDRARPGGAAELERGPVTCSPRPRCARAVPGCPARRGRSAPSRTAPTPRFRRRRLRRRGASVATCLLGRRGAWRCCSGCSRARRRRAGRRDGHHDRVRGRRAGRRGGARRHAARGRRHRRDRRAASPPCRGSPRPTSAADWPHTLEIGSPSGSAAAVGQGPRGAGARRPDGRAVPSRAAQHRPARGWRTGRWAPTTPPPAPGWRCWPRCRSRCATRCSPWAVVTGGSRAGDRSGSPRTASSGGAIAGSGGAKGRGARPAADRTGPGLRCLEPGTAHRREPAETRTR